MKKKKKIYKNSSAKYYQKNHKQRLQKKSLERYQDLPEDKKNPTKQQQYGCK